jgi:hypothetical protein
VILDTTTSTSSTTGAFRVAGGVGIQGNLNVGGNVTLSGKMNTLDANGDVMTFGNVTSTGNLSIVGNLIVGGSLNTLYASGSMMALGNLIINSTTPATSVTTGALQVSGGAGVGGNLYVGNTFLAQNYSELVNTTSTISSNTITVDYNAGTIYYYNNVTGAITGLTINNVPAIAGTNQSYTFTFILYNTPNISTTSYINPTLGTITINGTGSIPFRGVSNIAGNLSALSPLYIVQSVNIIVFNGSISTSTPVFTSAISY